MSTTTTTEVVKAEDFGIEAKQEQELMGNLPQLQAERDILIEQFNEVAKMDIADKKTIKLAKELRSKIRDNRTKGINIWHKTTKEYFLKGSQFIDAIKNKEIAVNQRMEDLLEGIEKHAEIQEKERLAELNEERKKLVAPFVDDVENLELSGMEDEIFEAFLMVKEKRYNDKIAEEQKAEEERLAKVEAEKKAIEEQRIENERLKKEAEEREAKIEAERKLAEKKLEAERIANQKKIDEANAKAQKEAEEKQAIIDAENAKQKAIQDKINAENAEKIRIANEEKAKLEQELNDKRQAEELAENNRKLAQKQEEEEAKLKAKAPEKEKLFNWIDALILDDIPTLNAENTKVAIDIQQKFAGFKNWSKGIIEKL